jgi:hypothetical protein
VSAAKTNPNRRPYILFEAVLQRLVVEFDDGLELDVSEAMANGRSNYEIVQRLIAGCLGLSRNSEGAKSDLVDEFERGYEVKSYKDPLTHPKKRDENVHTAASSTFGPNNHGPTIKRLLQAGKYAEALKICKETGFDKNEFYIYVNSGQFNFQVPLRFIIVPTSDVLRHLSATDPRVIARKDILGLAQSSSKIQPTG